MPPLNLCDIGDSLTATIFKGDRRNRFHSSSKMPNQAVIRIQNQEALDERNFEVTKDKREFFKESPKSDRIPSSGWCRICPPKDSAQIKDENVAPCQ
jgi:hypothetical protein